MRPRAALSSQQLVIGLLFVALATMSALVKAQSDTWWQLRSGRSIWETRSVSYVETYSYTAHGAFWPNHEWLAELLFFFAYSAGGMPMLAALCATAILVAYALSWRLTSGVFEVRFGLFAVSLTASIGAWSMRPQVLSMLCFMLTCALIAKDRVWLLPPFFVLWANLHAGVAIGLIAIGAVTVCDILVTRRLSWRLLSACAACFLATGTTPMGPTLWLLLVAYSQRTKTQGISEWMAPGLPPDYLAFWAIAGALLVLVLARWRRLDVASQRLVAVSLATMPLALGAHRNVAMFLLVGVPAVSRLWAGKMKVATSLPEGDNSRLNTVILAAAIVAGGLHIAMVWTNPRQQMGWAPIAPGAIAAVRACPKPIYNTHNIGGVLIHWVPDQPVFIDNRNDPYSIELLEENLRLEQSGEYEEAFAKYGFRCAIVETETKLEQRLLGDPNWSASYRNGRLAVFAIQ